MAKSWNTSTDKIYDISLLMSHPACRKGHDCTNKLPRLSFSHPGLTETDENKIKDHTKVWSSAFVTRRPTDTPSAEICRAVAVTYGFDCFHKGRHCFNQVAIFICLPRVYFLYVYVCVHMCFYDMCILCVQTCTKSTFGKLNTSVDPGHVQEIIFRK